MVKLSKTEIKENEEENEEYELEFDREQKEYPFRNPCEEDNYSEDSFP